jgi:hypothetical protein
LTASPELRDKLTTVGRGLKALEGAAADRAASTAQRAT